MPSISSKWAIASPVGFDRDGVRYRRRPLALRSSYRPADSDRLPYRLQWGHDPVTVQLNFRGGLQTGWSCRTIDGRPSVWSSPARRTAALPAARDPRLRAMNGRSFGKMKCTGTRGAMMSDAVVDVLVIGAGVRPRCGGAHRRLRTLAIVEQHRRAGWSQHAQQRRLHAGLYYPRDRKHGSCVEGAGSL